MTYNGVKLTAEEIMRIALIEPTDTPEEKQKLEDAIQRSSQKEAAKQSDAITQ